MVFANVLYLGRKVWTVVAPEDAALLEKKFEASSRHEYQRANAARLLGVHVGRRRWVGSRRNEVETRTATGTRIGRTSFGRQHSRTRSPSVREPTSFMSSSTPFVVMAIRLSNRPDGLITTRP